MIRKVLNGSIIILTLLFSCSKDKDEIKPVVVINTPSNLQQVNGIDTLLVSATISDDRNIERVTVSLRNSNDIPVLSTITKNPAAKSYTLSIPYIFDDIHLPSGQYDISVSASDGENTTTKYVSISLNETPKVKQGTFVISNTGSNSDIYYMDTTYNGSFYQSVTGDFLTAAVNSYDQQLVHASSVTGSLSAIALNSGSGLWNIPIISSPPTPYYTGFLYDNQDVYMGSRNGLIQGYDRNGASNYGASANNGYYMESALVHNNYYLVTEQQQLSGNLVKLVLYWLASGIEAQQISVNEDIKGVYTQTSNTIVLLTNDAGLNGKFMFYDIPSGLTSSPFNINVSQIDDCVEISSGIYLVAEGGDITLINANSFSTLPYLTGIGATKIWFDKPTNKLFVANSNVIDIYDYSSKNLLGNYVHTNIVEDVVFWYNK